MTPLRNIQTKEQVEHLEESDEEERLEKSPIAEAILKRPGSFSRSRSRTCIATNEETSSKTSSPSQEASPVKKDSVLTHCQQNSSAVEESQSDNLPKTEVPTSDESDKPFLEELVFPSLLGR
jgi:hypothetical protein